MAGGGEFYPDTKVVGPCSENPSLDGPPADGKLFHDSHCYDPNEIRNKAIPHPELRTASEQFMDFVGSVFPSASAGQPADTLHDPYEQRVASPVPRPPSPEQAKVASDKAINTAWDHFLQNPGIYGPPKPAFYTWARGFGFTTRDDYKGQLTPEELRSVNDYALSHSVGISPYTSKYTEQKS